MVLAHCKQLLHRQPMDSLAELALLPSPSGLCSYAIRTVQLPSDNSTANR